MRAAVMLVVLMLSEAVEFDRDCRARADHTDPNLRERRLGTPGRPPGLHRESSARSPRTTQSGNLPEQARRPAVRAQAVNRTTSEEAGGPVQQDPSASAFVEIGADRAGPYVNEPFVVEVRVGFDPVYFRNHAIQTTRQQLDVPVQVDASAFAYAPAGVNALADVAESKPARRMSLVVNGARVEAERIADRVVAGRPFTVVRIAKPMVATRAGTRTFQAPVLRFSYATRFDEDLVSGRVPVDRREAVVRGEEFSLKVVELPAAARPDGFGGAVGTFTARAELDKTEVAAGESLKLTLVVDGTGNLEGFDPPRPEFPGFRLYGVIDSKGPSRRIVYDLVPQDETVREVPSIAFVSFDPGPPAQYRVAKTAAIPIVVKPSAARSRPARVEAPAGPKPGVNDVFGLANAGALRAERAYLAGRHAEALGLFESEIASAGSREREGALLYDSGNALFRLGRPAEALVAYRRAKLRMPRDEQLSFNIGLTEHRLGIEAPASDAISAAFAAFTRGEVIAIGAALVAAAVAGWIFLRRRIVRIACVLLAVAGLAIAGRGAGIPWLAGPTRAVVIGNEIAVRAEPHAEGALVARLRAGEDVRVDESSDRWARVTQGGTTGWTERAGVGIVD